MSALKAKAGTLVLSHVNLAEITGPADPARAIEVADFYEQALPDMYFAQFEIDKALQQERRPRNAEIKLPPPPDLELLGIVAHQRPDTFRPFTIRKIVRVVAEHRERLGREFERTNRQMAEHINKLRLDPKMARDAQQFAGHNPSVPTMAILQELLRPVFLDKSLPIDANDSADIHHAITSISYCDYALLDGKWEDLSRRMTDRFAELGLPIHAAHVFSARRDGVERFLADLESWPVGCQ